MEEKKTAAARRAERRAKQAQIEEERKTIREGLMRIISSEESTPAEVLEAARMLENMDR